MSLQELSNAPLAFKINGSEYKVARLSIAEIWAEAERSVVQSYYKSVQEIAAGLPVADKMAYLKEATKGVPRGQELQDARQEWLNSVDGLSAILRAALNKSQKVTDDQIIEMIVKDPTAVEMVTAYVVGVEQTPGEPSKN